MPRARVGTRFLLRIPLLPYGAIDAGGDVAEQRSRLAALLERPQVSEAIFLASRTLHRKVDAWREDPDSDGGYKAELSLAKYVGLMASRPVPFGAFAGVATGDVDTGPGPQRSFTVRGPGEHRRRTRVHGEALCQLMAELPRIPSVRARLTFRTNTSASIAAGTLSYFQAIEDANGRLTDEYAQVSVELTPYLRSVVEEARRGATLEHLASALHRQIPDATPAEVEAYVEELADTQLLVPELGVWATGVEPMEGVARQLAEAGPGDMAASFERVREELAAIDSAGLGRPVSSYVTAVDRMKQLWRTARAAADVPGELAGELDAERLFHVDVLMTADRPVLAADVIRDVERTIDLLRQIAPRREDPALRGFRDALLERWGERDVPLAEALDESLGLGARLLAGAPPDDEAPERRDWLTALWQRASAERAREVVISPEDLAAQAHEPHEQARLPDAYSVAIRLGLLGEERQLWLQRVAGPSGARAIGRFCHADPDIEAMVRDHLAGEAEACPGAILAELVHLPDGLSADGLCRPVLRDHEIVVLGRGSASPERQIELEDLTVAARGGRVALRSQRLGRDIAPRLTGAYRLARSPFAVCRLLALLQAQDTDPVGWSWGPLEASAWLPRVRIGHVVVARERWRLDDDDATRLAQAWAEKTVEARRRRVQDAVESIRERRSLPRQFILMDEGVDSGDGELIDLEHRLLAQVFAGEVVVRKRHLLAEVYPAPEAWIARGPEGPHVSELVLTFVREPGASSVG